MKKVTPKRGILSDQRRLTLPVLTGMITLISATLLTQISPDGGFTLSDVLVVGLWVICIVYTIVFYRFILPARRRFEQLRWPNTVLICAGIILLQVILPQIHIQYFGVYLMLPVTLTSILYRRAQALFTFFILTAANILIRIYLGLTSPEDWIFFLTVTLAAFVLAETILRIQDTTQENIRRLKIVNEFAQKSASSLNTEDVLAALNSTIQRAVNADTYFVGILQGDTIHLLTLFDEGERFPPTDIKSEGTLSSWVIKNNTTLFIPDLREEPKLEGIKVINVGKEKLNLCWVGVPLKTPDVTGILVAASYTPHAFDRGDVELIENLAQHTAQALGNAFQHAKVEMQSRLDSLTGVYNHGYFIHILESEIEQAVRLRNPLSLVMIDIDYFKQYNDAYGHLAGDSILVSLCEIIRCHIKKADAVGRWGGEEFAILLPNADGLQALSVCRRIQEAMRQVAIRTQVGKTIPAPSISQGIAVCPDEAEEVAALIHLADKRLYLAKERGRNQIEPDERHWQNIKRE